MCLEITLCKYEANRILKLLSPDPQGQLKKKFSCNILYSCIHDLACAWTSASANCRHVDFVIKVMQTHLENLKISIKQCLFSLLRCVLGQSTKIVQK